MRKRKVLSLWPGAAVLLLALVFAPGCASSDSSDTTGGNGVLPDAPVTGESGTSAPASDDTPAGSDVAGDTVEATGDDDTIRPAQPGPGRPAQPSNDPGDVLERMSEDQRRVASELEAAASWTLARARQMVQSGQLERARDLLADILAQLRGQVVSTDALKQRTSELESLYNRIEQLLGDPVGDLANGLDAQHELLVDEARQEVTVHFEEGLQLKAEGRYEDAIARFERVLQIIRWAPYAADLEAQYRDRASDQMRECQRLARQQQTEEIERMRAIAREVEVLHRQRQEQRRLEDIETLWGDALFNMNLKRYSTAERLCEQILAMDPGFVKAREMKETIAGLRLSTFADRNQERRLDTYRQLWVDWYESKIPLVGRMIEYPTGDEWLRIKARAASGWQDVQDSPTVQRIRSTLETTVVQVNFEDEPLNEAIEYLASRANLNILLDPDLRRIDDPVHLTLQNLPLANSLRLLLDMVGLKYVIKEEGLVWITEADNNDVTDRMILRLHDVRDLTSPVRDFPGTRIRLRANEGDDAAGPIWEDDFGPEVDPIEVGLLEDIIRENIQLDSWDVDSANIMTAGGQLLVRNTAEVHNEIRDFLQSLRDVSGLVVTIESRFITIDDFYIQDFGVDWRGLGGQSPGSTVLLDDVSVDTPDNGGGLVDNGSNNVPPGNAIAGLFFNNGGPASSFDGRGRFENVFDTALGSMLQTTGGLGLQFTIFQNNDSQFQMVVNALQKSRNATVLVAPRLSAFNTQRANLTVINQVSYIRDFSVETAISAAVADPIVDTIADGLVLDVQPTVSNDRRFITLELQPTVARLIRPIPEFVTTVAGPGSTPVTIQLPELVLQSLQTTVMVPDGGVVVVGGMKEIRDVDREATTPLLGDIPIIGALFRRKGRSLENRSLVIVVKAVITDLAEQEARMP